MASDPVKLAKEAEALFKSGAYDKSVAILKRLDASKADGSDIRLKNNILVAEFAQGTINDAEDLLNRFRALSIPAVAPAHEDVEFASGQSADADEKLIYHLNTARLLYTSREFVEALALVQPLFESRREHSDPGIFLQIAYIYIEMMLQMLVEQQFALEASSILSKICGAIAVLEKKYAFLGIRGSCGPFADSEEEAKSLENDGISTGRESGQIPKLSLPEQAQAKCHVSLYKSYLNIYLGNLKAAKKDIRGAQDVYQKELKSSSAETADESCDSYALAMSSLKAQMEFRRKNFRKTAKLLQPLRGEGLSEVIYFNNLGCLHARMQRYHLASSFFSKALAALSSAEQKDRQKDLKEREQREKEETSRGLSTGVPLRPRVEVQILYNSGLQFLATSRPKLAFRCFHKCIREFHENPRLWLRLGESCVMNYDQQLHPPFLEKRQFVRGTVAMGNKRKIVLPTGSSSLSPSSSDYDDGSSPDESKRSSSSSQNYPESEMTIPFAVKCFRNAIALLAARASFSESNIVEEGERAGPASSSTAHAPSEAEVSISVEDMAKRRDTAGTAVRIAALCMLSYACLCMNDPSSCLKYTEELLLREPECDGKRRFLAELYNSEALCLLGRPDAAFENLAKNIESGLSEVTVARQDAETPQERSGIFVNLSIISVVKNDLPQAKKYMAAALKEWPASPHALRLHIYLLLREGQSSKAVEVLRKCRLLDVDSDTP